MKVTVLLTTYNHEEYIAQALDSVLQQETDFPFEIVVLEDCSIDNTCKILIDFKNRYPTKVRLVLAPNNQNDNKTFAAEFKAAKGQYIALLDGDDYWTSPYKLRRQVAFLDAHPECTICFHDAAVYLPDGSQYQINYTPQRWQIFWSLAELFEQNFIASCSVMLRNHTIGELPQWYNSMAFGDWPLYILHALYGKIGYLNAVMGAYRNHGQGVWTGMPRTKQFETVIEFLKAMNDNLEFAYQKEIKFSISKYYFNLAEAYAEKENRLQARNAFKKGFQYCAKKQISLQNLRLWLRICSLALKKKKIKRLILFLFHKNWDVCRNRLQILRALNPGLPIYGLFGGSEEDFGIVRKQLSQHCEDIYLLRGKSRRWKWQNTDLAVCSWFRDIGRYLSTDVVHVVQWDLLMFKSLDRLYAGIPLSALGLTGLTRVDQIADRWTWMINENSKREWLTLKEWAFRHYSYHGEFLACLGPGYCLPSEFLERYCTTAVPELCHDELRLPLFAKILGFETCDTGFYPKWFDKEEERFFNADTVEVNTDLIKEELARFRGRRVFHPYRSVFPWDEAQRLIEQSQSLC